MRNNTKLTDNSKRKTVGWFTDIDGLISGLFADHNKLFLQLNDLRYVVDERTTAKTEILNVNGQRKFSLFDETSLIASFKYSVEIAFNHIPPVEYLDDDEFDWGLFLSNIINNASRKTEFINNNS
ncbi:hypothetical protein KXD93_15910 [Mucilaginibacter sp. BJC16-A38]|uniref:hypothetical protein n=1 Tax=Mucilaginibacter phenanthrenivorans TaxID=1234842 RepID=UPI002157D612|nr:hypothetical protein [Mucilaginibacter phenanthrenivorans]MCR8559143.1 hypothetical protein [Mucilaginibacter phenanthrenivorans]